MYELCSKLTIKTTERRQWLRCKGFVNLARLSKFTKPINCSDIRMSNTWDKVLKKSIFLG